MPHAADVDVTPGQISALASADAVAAFLTALGYTAARTPLTPEAIGLAGDSAAAIKSIEVMAEDPEGLLRVVFVHLRSLTAKGRNDLARVLARSNVEYLLILTSDFSALEFVLIDKRRREKRGPDGVERLQIVPLAFAVPRKAPATRDLRILRRLTWTCRDGLEQFDKLKNLFQAAAFSEDYFCNRALFADHYLLTRLREDAAWADNPNQAFRQVKDLLRDAPPRWRGQGEPAVRADLYEPIFRLLGFKPQVNKPAGDDQTKPDYLLSGEGGEPDEPLTAAFVYAWDRWLDGPDYSLDQQTPDENPGASVVTALEQGLADWIIVTNGRQWRVYSRQAHSRATNFYEVDLPEALIASGDTDPNEAFRYWWLFFRAAAFRPAPGQAAGCWLDQVAEGSRDYAKGLGERLKERIFETIFPHLAQGLLDDRKKRLGSTTRPSDAELRDTFEATLTLLYRLLFLLYAESRDLVPIRESAYREASLKRIKEEIAEAAGVAESEVDRRLDKAYSASDTGLYDRLQHLFAAMDRGSPKLNVPTYNGGLFLSKPSTPAGPPDTNPTRQREAPPDTNPTRQREAVAPATTTNPTRQREAPPSSDHDIREQRIARFLLEHKVPDRFLAKAIDRLARDPDDKTFKLAFIDYKSLEVRHLGSIYEGLLEFKLKVAAEDLATKTEKKRERYIPLSAAKAKRGREAEVAVPKGSVYLSNDKAERKASGSYYTPDPIVEYIVQQTVGPVLAEKLEALRPEFRKVRKTFDNELQKARAYPVRTSGGETRDPRPFALQKTYAAHKELVERLFEFRCLDPAMGSGHFLVEAVDFITDRLLTFLNQFPINPVTFMLDQTRRNILEALGEQGVSVEPAKLTDINLLKRHVLKRCIYGVDLNPMAVELAKVSLWLDAFTLGAPLSFLDHHLRCGNSLVGATFADLKAAAKGTLFGIDYEPLLRAIQHVLVVNKMADATAAEVRRSASEYSQARDELSGYQIVLDLLVAKYFGHSNAPGLLEHGNDLDLASRADFMKSLVDLQELALVERVEELSRQPDRRFFHWEIEFPEVFFSFADTGQRHLKHKNDLAAGSAGFDAVVANPPYVRVELLNADLKHYLKTFFQSVVDRCDIYVAFLELAHRLLRRSRLCGLIISNQFLNTDYGTRLRKLISDRQSLWRLVDISPLQVFEGALTYPAIIICSSSPKNTLSVSAMGTHTSSSLGAREDTAVFSKHAADLTEVSATVFYRFPVWSALRACQGSTRSLDEVEAATLNSICNISSSMKSGRDSVLVGQVLDEAQDAFVIALRGADAPLTVKRTLWRRVLRPKNLKDDGASEAGCSVVFWPYLEDWENDSFLLVEEGQIAKQCPATYRHLVRHKPALQDRRDSGRTWEQHGNAWYALARIGKPSDYRPPKLLSPGEFRRPRFMLDSSTALFPCARIIGLSCIAVGAKALRGYLLSSVVEQWLLANLPPKGGGYRGMSVGDVARLPVPPCAHALWKSLATAESRGVVDEIVGAWLTGQIQNQGSVPDN